jgi:hypothetical protein
LFDLYWFAFSDVSRTLEPSVFEPDDLTADRIVDAKEQEALDEAPKHVLKRCETSAECRNSGKVKIEIRVESGLSKLRHPPRAHHDASISRTTLASPEPEPELAKPSTSASSTSIGGVSRTCSRSRIHDSPNPGPVYIPDLSERGEQYCNSIRGSTKYDYINSTTTKVADVSRQ